MLKQLAQPRSNSVSSSPRSTRQTRYASPSPRTTPNSPLRKKSIVFEAASPTFPAPPPLAVQYVHRGTQCYSPIQEMKNEGSADSLDAPAAQPRQTDSSDLDTPSAAPKPPTIPVDSPKKKRSSQDDPPSTVGQTHTQELPLKRVRSEQPVVKVLPAKYELCAVEDLVTLIANMISELIETNDTLPPISRVLTRYHSRTPPGISVHDYLQRLAKHATLTPPLLLSMVYYIDRLCSLYPAFSVTTLTVHRFLITAATVAAKGLSDSFWNNATYARVGGIKLAELGLLELDFLYRVDWKIVPNPEVLVDYYKGLVKRSDSYVIDNEEDSMDDDEAGDEANLSSPVDSASTSSQKEGTDAKWQAWMDSVSTQQAGTIAAVGSSSQTK